MKSYLIFSISILVVIYSKAQKSNLYISAETGSGFVLKHNAKMANLANSHPTKYEFTIQKQTTGSKEWHHQYNLPKIAYSLILIDYKNPVIDKTYAANIQLIYPFIKKKHIMCNAVIGLGLGYNTRPFDRVSNYQNIALGSKLTGSMHAKMFSEITLSNKISSIVGVGFIHFSNGAAKLPNLGINVPYLNFGINYKIANGKENFDFTIPDNYSTTSNLIDLSVGSGYKDVGFSGGKRYFFNVLSVKKHVIVNNVSHFIIGTELFYDRSVKEFRENSGLKNDKNRNLKNGILFGYELRMSRVYAVVNYGYYTYQSYNNVYANAYQRYQIKYKFKKNYYSAIGLKVHKGVADLIEFTVGVEL